MHVTETAAWATASMFHKAAYSIPGTPIVYAQGTYAML